MKNKKLLTKLLVATIFASTLLVGCGDSDDDDDEEVSTSLQEAIETRHEEKESEKEVDDEEDEEDEDDAFESEDEDEDYEADSHNEGDKTLEDYFDDHYSELADIEEESGCIIDVDGNTMTYIFNLGGTYTDSEISQLQESFDESMASMEDVFTSSKDMIEKEAKCGPITMVITYVDDDNNEIYSATF